MTIAFDFDGPEYYGVQNGIAAQGFPWQFVTLVTVPLATAPFPLQSGRMVEVHVEYAGLDSNGVPLGATANAAIAGGVVTPTAGGGSANVGGSPVGQPQLVLNGSGDLLVQYCNQQSTGNPSHDIAVRVTTRWVGA